LLDHGADLDAREVSGKSPRDMAEELKGIVPFNKGLTDAGYSSTGLKKYGRLSEVSPGPSLSDRVSSRQRNTDIASFILPTIVLLCIFQTFVWSPIYSAIPLAVAEFYAMQLVRTAVDDARTLTHGRSSSKCSWHIGSMSR
jgi:palmitoyltransferase